MMITMIMTMMMTIIMMIMMTKTTDIWDVSMLRHMIIVASVVFIAI